MITLEDIKSEISEILTLDALTDASLDRLYKLYVVCSHMGEAPEQAPYSEDLPMVTREFADSWVEAMENDDGTKGAHWNFDQCKTVLARKGYSHNPNEWYIVLNMMYSDYCKVAKAFGINAVDFCTLLADAFLHDKDARSGKTMAYYNAIVK